MVDDRPVLLIATTNRGKLREVRAVLADVAVRLVGLEDYPGIEEAVEDGETFDDNARAKALHYARLVGGWALADDSGLEVDALGGDPGVHSARYAGPESSDKANNAKLMAALRNVREADRSARFRCAMALVGPEGVVATSSGAIEGRVIDEPAGENGFGYDPHFFVPDHGMTAAQMAPELKNRISHRGKALAAIKPEIERAVARPTSSA